MRATMDERRGPEEVVGFMLRALAETYADFERAVNANGGADLLITSDLAYAGPILAEKSGFAGRRRCSRRSRFFPPTMKRCCRRSRGSAAARAGSARLRGHLARRQAGREEAGAADHRIPSQPGPETGQRSVLRRQASPELVLAMFSRAPRRAAARLAAADRRHRLCLLRRRRTDLARGDRGVPRCRATADCLHARIGGGLRSRPVLHRERPSAARAGAAPRGAARRSVTESAPLADAADRRVRLRAVLEAVSASRRHRASGRIGTTGQAMRAGRPMLVVPYAHDQPDNAMRAKEAREFRKRAPRAQYNAERRAQALAPLLQNRRVAQRAGEIAGIVSHENGAGAAADAIEETFAGDSPVSPLLSTVIGSTRVARRLVRAMPRSPRPPGARRCRQAQRDRRD